MEPLECERVSQGVNQTKNAQVAKKLALTLGAHPANLGGCSSHLHQVGNPTYLMGKISLHIQRLTVAGQRRSFTELPLQGELFSCVRTKPYVLGVGN